jgi:hypothetical protein
MQPRSDRRGQRQRVIWHPAAGTPAARRTSGLSNEQGAAEAARGMWGRCGAIATWARGLMAM